MGHSRVEVVTVSLRLIGLSEPGACDREHAEPIRESRREVVEHVGRVAESGDEQEARPVASPVEQRELDAALGKPKPSLLRPCQQLAGSLHAGSHLEKRRAA